MLVKDMTIDELKIVIREIIEETLTESIDPDEGMTLKPEVREYLLELQQRRKSKNKGIPAKEVYEKLGIKW